MTEKRTGNNPNKKATDSRPAEQRAFESLEKVTSSRSAPRNLIERLIEKTFKPSTGRKHDWVGDAEWAEIEQEPIKGRTLIYGIGITVILLVLWASVASLDEVTRGEGRIIPSRQLQVVQAIDGGVVEELFVREGDIVEAGDLLIRLDKIRSQASFQESRFQVLALKAKVARLEGLIENQLFILAPDIVQEIPDIARREMELYEQSRRELEEQLSIYREQLNQRRKELEEAQARLSHSEQNLELARQELESTRPLLRSGAVSEIDVLRLQREFTGLKSDIAQTRARIGMLKAAIAESVNRIDEADIAMRNRWRAELSEALANLASLEESTHRLADMVRSSEIRAPVRGIVQRLFYNTIGGVVPAGREVAEIVPLDDQLLVEAKILPPDVAFLRPGLPATVKLSAYDFTIYGGLKAELEHISADSITDERGNTFFIVRVRTHESSLGEDLPIIPGMTAQVDILTGKKTVLAYLLKPVLRATSNAMSER